jgi:hypothetical protein
MRYQDHIANMAIIFVGCAPGKISKSFWQCIIHNSTDFCPNPNLGPSAHLKKLTHKIKKLEWASTADLSIRAHKMYLGNSLAKSD